MVADDLEIAPGESLTYTTAGSAGSVRSPIGVSTLIGVLSAVHPPGALWQVSALRMTVIVVFWASTRSGAGSAAEQPGAPGAREAPAPPFSEPRLDQHAKVSARIREASLEWPTASTCWLDSGPLTPVIRSRLPSLSLLT